MELTAAIVGALVAGFAAGWMLASRSRMVESERLRDSFQALAATALKQSTDEFLKLADQKIGNVHKQAAADLGQRQQALTDLVTPIRDTLSQVDAKLADVEKQRVSDSSGLRSLLAVVGQTQQELQLQTHNLVRALRSPGVRGRWGEVQLRKVVELAGMMEHCDFDEQPTAFTEAGRLKVSMTAQTYEWNPPWVKGHEQRMPTVFGYDQVKFKPADPAEVARFVVNDLRRIGQQK